jgi:streptogramin lyase
VIFFVLLLASAQTIAEFPVSGQPYGIALGPDGNIWFTERLGNRIGRITPNGVISEFAIPTPGSEPMSIAVGPDGNLWFTETAAGKIGRITSDGRVINEFPVTAPITIHPIDITAGPDGNLWFTTQEWIVRMSIDGQITLFGTNYGASGTIASGPDGNLWFTANSENGWKICRITPSGVNTPFYGPYGEISDLGRIAAGPDGSLWFTGNNWVGRITVTGVITLFAAPARSGGILAGQDGTLWVVDPIENRLAQITTDGVVAAEFPIPTPGSGPVALALGRDGSIWFTEALTNKIGRLSPASRKRVVRH